LFAVKKENATTHKFNSILIDSQIDEGLLRTGYLMYMVNSIQYKQQLDAVLNAQLAITYEVGDQL